MMQHYYIAGLRVRMDTFGRTLTQAEPYRCEPFERAEVTIRSDWQELNRQQPQLSRDDCEYITSGGSFYRQLLHYSGMMLHASCIVLDGKAYLFTAPSGTGKSTHTQLWLKVFGDRAQILNDDKPAIRLVDGTWYAYGTPWSGKTDMNTNIKAPIAGICVLSRGPENRIKPCGTHNAIRVILEQTVRSPNAAFMEILLGLVDRLVTNVPVWHLECNKSPEAAAVSYGAMSAGRKEE